MMVRPLILGREGDGGGHGASGLAGNLHRHRGFFHHEFTNFAAEVEGRPGDGQGHDLLGRRRKNQSQPGRQNQKKDSETHALHPALLSV